MFSRFICLCLLATCGAAAQPECIDASTSDYYRKTAPPSAPRRWVGGGDSRGTLAVVAVDDSIWSGLYAFRTDTGQLLWHKPLLGQVSQIAVSPNGQWLAVALSAAFCRAPKIQLWNARTGEQMPKLPGSVDEQGYSVAFSQDSRFLAGSVNGSVTVWDAATRADRRDIEPPGFDTKAGIERIRNLSFDPKLPRLSGENSNGVRYTWDWKTGKLVSRVSKPPDSATPRMGDQAVESWPSSEGYTWRLSAPGDGPASSPLRVDFVGQDGKVRGTLTIPPREQ